MKIFPKKINGASITSILNLLSKDFVKLINFLNNQKIPG